MSKKMRIIVGVLLATVCVCIAAALIFPVDKTIIYRSDNISVKQVEYEERNYVHSTRMGITADEAFAQHAVILSGTIRNVREAEVSYSYEGFTGESPITLFDVSASDVLFSSTNKIPKWGDLTVGVGFNSRMMDNEMPILEDGKSFLMFCLVTADMENDPLATKEYADLWVWYSDSLMFEQSDDQIMLSYVFEDTVSKAGLTVTPTEQGSWVKKEDFVEMLRQKVDELW